jgi:hypothetical protein
VNADRGDLTEFVDAMQRIGVEQLTEQLGVPPGAASDVMRRITDRICWEYARRSIYVPVAYDPRNREIVDKYHRQGRSSRACTPARIRELAAEYGLTERRIYDILKEAREADYAARQAVLPGLETVLEQAA